MRHHKFYGQVNFRPIRAFLPILLKKLVTLEKGFGDDG